MRPVAAMKAAVFGSAPAERRPDVAPRRRMVQRPKNDFAFAVLTAVNASIPTRKTSLAA